MRLFLSFVCALVCCTVSALLTDVQVIAQDATSPPSLVRALRKVAAQPGGATYKVRNIRGVSNRPLNELCGTRLSPDARRRLRGARRVRVDPSPVPTDPSFDLRTTTGNSFPVKNQLSCGCCWIFGAVGAFAGNSLKNNANATFRFSEQYIGDGIYFQTGNNPCDGGFPDVALQFLKDFGTVAEADYAPYTGQFQPRQPRSDAPYHAISYDYVSSNPDVETPSVQEIKKKLVANGALVVTVAVGDTFQNYASGVFNDDITDPINHAVALIGWDDNPPEGGGGVWILRNSWGPQWGENGYMRIKWGVSSIGFGAMYVNANPDENHGTQPPPPPSPPDRSAIIKQRISWWEANYPDYTKD